MLESVERPRARTKISCVCHPPSEWNPSGGRGVGRERRFGLVLALGFGFVLLTARTGWSQDDVKNFKKPILMVETGGHHAPVRSLIWHNGPAPALLSGGEDKVVKVWDFQMGLRLVRSGRRWPMTDD